MLAQLQADGICKHLTKCREVCSGSARAKYVVRDGPPEFRSDRELPVSLPKLPASTTRFSSMEKSMVRFSNNSIDFF